MSGGPRSWCSPVAALAMAGIVALLAVTLGLLDRTPVCRCGYVKLWHGVTLSAENSQHLSDWHTYHLALNILMLVAPLEAVRRWQLGA